MIVDGRAIAEDIYRELTPFFKSRGAKLGIVVVGENPVIESFVGIKTRAAGTLAIAMERIDVPERASQDQVLEAISRLAGATDAVIAQLPMPKTIDIDAVLSRIPKEKDVDALNPCVEEDDRPVQAPVALAVVEILRRSSVPIEGAKVVVVGEGRLVGKPTAWLLATLGARVSVFSLDKGSIEDLKSADIIVSGAGKPGLIKPQHIKKGAALIDAGTSEQGKKVVGDIDPACETLASVFTPVPGGVGPVAVAMIFRNLRELIGRQ